MLTEARRPLLREVRQPATGGAAENESAATPGTPPSGGDAMSVRPVASGQIDSLIQEISRLFGWTPTWVPTGCPSLNRIRVGMARTP